MPLSLRIVLSESAIVKLAIASTCCLRIVICREWPEPSLPQSHLGSFATAGTSAG